MFGILGTSNQKIVFDWHLFCTSMIITGNLWDTSPISEGTTVKIGWCLLRCPSSLICKI